MLIGPDGHIQLADFGLSRLSLNECMLRLPFFFCFFFCFFSFSCVFFFFASFFFFFCARDCYVLLFARCCTPDSRTSHPFVCWQSICSLLLLDRWPLWMQICLRSLQNARSGE